MRMIQGWVGILVLYHSLTRLPNVGTE